MVTTDDYRSLQLTAANHGIERQPKPVALAEPDPANTSRQALKLNSLTGRVQPVMQVFVVRNHLLNLSVRLVNIFRVTRQSHPAERTYTTAEQGPDVGGNESRKVEGVLYACVKGHLSNVVAVIEGRYALLLKLKHRLDVNGH